MILYHGSNTGNIKVLKPNQADHDRPYVYMTTIDVVAALYLCNAVDRPYYWFPYGFEGGSDIPVYHELYPDALREVSNHTALTGLTTPPSCNGFLQSPIRQVLFRQKQVPARQTICGIPSTTLHPEEAFPQAAGKFHDTSLHTPPGFWCG